MTTMDRYYVYTFGESVFYESPADLGSPEGFAGAEAPPAWTRTRRDVWTVMTPPDRPLPSQGWKIHISSTMDDAVSVLAAVREYCREHGIAFKHLSSPEQLAVFNGKYMPRGTSGKFITVYPIGEAEFETAVCGLAEHLDRFEAPGILGDLRWRGTPVHVRYGAFKARHVTAPSGEDVPAVEDPDGRLVPDRRGPVFSPPEWAPMPPFLKAEADRQRGSAATMAYTVTGALHFSNAGGIYTAVDGTGREVVLKEARRHAGLDAARRPAHERLAAEHRTLQTLQGVPGVPALIDRFTVDGHEFMAMEKLPGVPAWKWLAANHPNATADPSDADQEAFTAKVAAVADRLRALLALIHAKGVVYGDLHPGNLLITDDLDVSLVDFEVSGRVAGPAHVAALGASGFRPAVFGRKGTDGDETSAALLALWCLTPHDRMWEIDPTRIRRSLREALAEYPVPRRMADWLRERLDLPVAAAGSLSARAADGHPSELGGFDAVASVPELVSSMARAVEASATPERDDRLFPGDISVFSGDGAGFAHGAAGVLWALRSLGLHVATSHVDWLLAKPVRDTRPSFYTGTGGVAYTLDALGHREAAMELLERSAPHVDRVTEPNLYSGLAGIALNYLHFGLTDRAEAIGHRLVRVLEADARPTARPGLCYGWTGPALLFGRLAAATGDDRWWKHAGEALAKDTARLVERPDGSVLLGEKGGRALPYLASGTAGIALVIGELPELGGRELLAPLLRSLRPLGAVEGNLFEGRAGLIAVAARLHRLLPDADLGAVVESQYRRMRLYGVGYRGHLAFPGRQQLRLSMDVATGTAGVMLGLAAIDDPHRPLLPFLNGRPSADLQDSGTRAPLGTDESDRAARTEGRTTPRKEV